MSEDVTGMESAMSPAWGVPAFGGTPQAELKPGLVLRERLCIRLPKVHL